MEKKNNWKPKGFRYMVVVLINLCLVAALMPATTVFAASNPSIMITSYSTSPETIVPGEQFSLSITIKNEGAAAASNITAAISGASLTAVGTGNSDFITSLAAGAQTTLTFTLKSDGSATSTRENLTVDFSYESADATPYTSSQTIGVTYTEKAGIGTAKPRLFVSDYSTTPASIKAGQKFSLKVKVKNKGDATAKNTVATASSTLAKILTSSSKKYLSSIAPGQSKSFSFRLIADKSLSTNSGEATIELAYEDSNDVSYTASQTVGLVFSAAKKKTAKKKTSTTSPRVSVINYATNPMEIAPGERFGLSLDIKNMTSRSAKNIVVTVGASSDTATDTTDTDTKTSASTSAESFAAVDSSNTRFISSLASGSKQEVDFNMMAGPSVNAGLYNLAINLSYLDDKNNKVTSSENIGLIVKRKPSISVLLNNKPKLLTVGDDFKFSFDVYNLSDFTVKGVVITALGEGISADIAKDSKFIGTIESGDSESIEVNGGASLVGQKKVILRVQYRDDFGQTTAIERPINIKVKEKEATIKQASNENGSSNKNKSFFAKVIDFLKALLGIG